MLYRNEKTGVVIDVNSVLGGDWKKEEKKTEKSAKEANSRQLMT